MTQHDILYHSYDINTGVHLVASAIRTRFENPHLWVILNGAVMFASDLVKYIPNLGGVEFIRIKRGYGIRKPHAPELLDPVPTFLRKYQHIWVDIIAETGMTMEFAKSLVPKQQKSYTCALVCKDYTPDFYHFKTDTPLFLTGYGMGPDRWLPYIATLGKGGRR